MGDLCSHKRSWERSEEREIAATLLAAAASLFGSVNLAVSQLAAAVLTGVVGAIPFCAFGLLLGSLSSGRAAPAVVNLIYLLLIYFSGLFVTLPKALESVVKVSPAFYLHQLVLAAVGAKTFMVNGALTHIAILLGATAACLALSARRLNRVG